MATGTSASATSEGSATNERNVEVAGGWPMLLLNIAVLCTGPALVVYGAVHAPANGAAMTAGFALAGALVLAAGFIMNFGFFALQPNEARVLILLGAYHGTVRRSGFHWANPLYARTRGRVPAKPGAATESANRNSLVTRRVAGLMGQSLSTTLSLRAHNFNGDTLKVNDKRGNPVEIGAVVVWRVGNTAQAVFDVEDYATYVEVQSESAIRSIASRYAYDHGEEHELTLRGGTDEIATALKEELQARLSKAGVVVIEARLTHLAYAPEIAPVMLRRQQAESIIAARQIIVQNAVSMVHMALDQLDHEGVVKLDEERKAAMVSNLLVVLCGNSDPAPVINTGTLYS